MNLCDHFFKDLTGKSLVAELYHGKGRSETFDDILFTNPALVAIDFCLATILQEAEVFPEYVLGYSLGELTAAVVSGVLTLEEGIGLSVDFARLLLKRSPPGGMLAVIGDNSLLQAHSQAFAGLSVSARNFQSNFVISGPDREITELQAYLVENGIAIQRLPVKFGFHSPIIEPLKESFIELAGRFSYQHPRINYLSAQKVRAVTDVDETHFWDVVRQPVNFQAAIENILAQEECVFVDVGPSGSLATAVKYILPENSPSLFIQCMTQFGDERLTLQKAISALRKV